jgi:hypothetical protein
MAQVISAVAWDSVKDRLLVALTGDHPLAGHALLYATVPSPVLSAVCLGPIYLPGHTAQEDASEAQAPVGCRVVAMHAGSARGTLLASRNGERSVSVIPIAVRDAVNPFNGRNAGHGPSVSSGTMF